MKGCVDEYSECSVDEIAEKYIEGTPEVDTVAPSARQAAKAKICSKHCED